MHLLNNYNHSSISEKMSTIVFSLLSLFKEKHSVPRQITKLLFFCSFFFFFFSFFWFLYLRSEFIAWLKTDSEDQVRLELVVLPTFGSSWLALKVCTNTTFLTVVFYFVVCWHQWCDWTSPRRRVIPELRGLCTETGCCRVKTVWFLWVRIVCL